MNIGRWIVGAGALTAGLAVAPGVASAHTANANASCDGLAVNVDNWPDGVTTVVTIDGDSTTRSGEGAWTFPWDASREHAWSVSVDGPGDEFDRRFDGTQEACVEATTTTTEPATTTSTSTTLPSTTTTQPGAPTTTALGGAAPATTTAGGAGPATTIAGRATPTTARVATGGVSGSTGTLPATGRVSTPLIAAATVTVLAGVALWFAARRRPVG